jgi:hypothetical protein
LQSGRWQIARQVDMLATILPADVKAADVEA